MRCVTSLACLALVLGCIPAHAQDVQANVQKLNDHLFRIDTAGPGGTAACVASTGPDGILLVDTGVETAAPKLKEALDRLGGKLSAIVLTHEHADHTGGLALLGHGVPVYAHPKVRAELTSGFNVLRELPGDVLPDKPVDAVTTLRFNGEEVRLIPVPGGHSDTDVVVFFVGSKVACLGGFGDPARFPFVDRNKGGAVAPYPELTARLLDALPADTRLVPGHGQEADVAALRKFRSMLLQTTHDAQQALSSGKDPKTLDAKELFKGFESYGQGFVTQALWLKFLTDEDARRSGKAAPAKKSLAEPLHDALVSGGASAVVAKYRELKASAPGEYDFNEYVLNAFGYHLLLNKNRPADAIVVLKANVEEYPEAFNPYDSLGEAYLATGQRDLALASYRKALEVNPDFQNAKAQIERIEGMQAKEKPSGGGK